MPITSHWFRGGGWLRASLWSFPGGLYDVEVGKTEKMLDGHLGSELDQKGKRVVFPDRCGQSWSRSVGGTYEIS